MAVSYTHLDEPTGALDSKTSVEVMQILKDLHKLGMTIVVVTHERDVYKRQVQQHQNPSIRKRAISSYLYRYSGYYHQWPSEYL